MKQELSAWEKPSTFVVEGDGTLEEVDSGSLPFKFRGGFVGYLGYELRHEVATCIPYINTCLIPFTTTSRAPAQWPHTDTLARSRQCGPWVDSAFGGTSCDEDQRGGGGGGGGGNGSNSFECEDRRGLEKAPQMPSWSQRVPRKHNKHFLYFHAHACLWRARKKLYYPPTFLAR